MNKAALNPESLPGPTLEDFAEAQRALRGVVQETPIEISRYLSEVLGQPVHLKCENLQRTGAYKFAAPITASPSSPMRKKLEGW